MWGEWGGGDVSANSPPPHPPPHPRFAAFRKDAWWFASIDMLRRLALTNLPLLFDTNLLQLEVAFAVNVVSMLGTQYAKPHYDKSADVVQYG